MLQPLTYQIFRFLCTFHQTHGYSPTLREIQAALTLSRSYISHHLDLLHAHGYIERQRYRARCIVILHPCGETEAEPS